jgi:putative Mn2+ efflux pump MntP
MTQLIIFGLLAGLDNLQLGASLALLPLARRRRHQLAAAFCVSEIGGALLGVLIGGALLTALAPLADWLALAAMLACGTIVLVLALRHEDNDLTRFVNRPVLLMGLPVSLSLDNVIAGAGIGVAGYPLTESALIVGLISAALACGGLYAGGWIRRFLPDRTELGAGIYLILLAFRGFWMELR